VSGVSGVEVDVLVVGGGIVGTVAAVGFARAGFSTALLEPAPVTRPGDEYAERVSSINLASEATLTAFEVWPLLARGRLSPFERIEVWAAGSGGGVNFDAADSGLDHLAHILENDLVAAAARERLESLPEYRPTALGVVTGLDRVDGYNEIATADGTAHRCRLVVAADGAGSTLRRLAGIHRKIFDYRQKAVVARVFTERPHGRTARQKFLPTGPLAFLPLADGSVSIVWSLDNDAADDVLLLDDGAFAESLGEAFDRRLGRITGTGPRRAFPLRRTHAERYFAEGLALVGDACHTTHPLAGLGANQGIADAHALVEAVSGARSRGQQFWGSRVLAAYQRRRRPANAATLAAMDVFHLGFTGEMPLAPRVRGALLTLADSSPAAKRFFVARASGLAP
jgi:2-octaprenylphenol hydroxylase